jgi:hypothetical protein
MNRSAVTRAINIEAIIDETRNVAGLNRIAIGSRVEEEWKMNASHRETLEEVTTIIADVTGIQCRVNGVIVKEKVIRAAIMEAVVCRNSMEVNGQISGEWIIGPEGMAAGVPATTGTNASMKVAPEDTIPDRGTISMNRVWDSSTTPTIAAATVMNVAAHAIRSMIAMTAARAMTEIEIGAAWVNGAVRI